MKGKTMNQEMKDEIKVAVVTTTLNQGSKTLKRIKDLQRYFGSYAESLNDDNLIETFDNDLNNFYFYLTDTIPENIGYELLKLEPIWKGTSAGNYLEQKKFQIDQEYSDEISELNDDYPEGKANEEQISAAKPHVAKFIYAYKHLAWQISEAIK
jgi:hypothetical protein